MYAYFWGAYFWGALINGVRLFLSVYSILKSCLWRAYASDGCLAQCFEIPHQAQCFKIMCQAQHFKIFVQTWFSVTMRQTCIMSGIVYTRHAAQGHQDKWTVSFLNHWLNLGNQGLFRGGPFLRTVFQICTRCKLGLVGYLKNVGCANYMVKNNTYS